MEFNNNIDNPHSVAIDQFATWLSGYDITHNLDMSVIHNPSEIWNTAGFVPIGGNPSDGNAPFTGTVYGNSETISSLYIDRPGDNDIGLFGYTGNNALIEFFTMNDSSITGQNNVGAVAGTNGGSIQYVISSYDGQSGLVTGVDNVGGIAGTNSGSITYSQNVSTSTGVTVIGMLNMGGIAGANGTNGTIGEDINSGTVEATDTGFQNVGGLAGTNAGVVTQSINTGNIGSGFEINVGGVVGYNSGQVDDSYSGGGTFAGTINGATNVGGIVGNNATGAVMETSYNTSTVEGSGTAGGLVGINGGTARHSYYDNQTTSQTEAIGTNNDPADTTDVPAGGFTTDELMDARNFAQGDAPQYWDFRPSYGDGDRGVWAINAYNSGGQINDGLPVLQWQYPADAQVTATNGTQSFGYQPGYTVAGNGANNFPIYVPNPNVTVTGDPNAGGTQQITVSGTPNVGGYEVEYVNGTTNIVPDQLTITADSFTISSGATPPPFTVTYSGFQPNGSPSDITGVNVTETPPGNADGRHVLTPSSDPNSNYIITYVNGTLTVGRAATPPPSAQFTTFETEIENVQQNFASDPTNGLDPIFFLLYPNMPALGGEQIGAIYDPPGDDLAFASGTSNLPAFERLVTPGVGVVEIVDGVIIVGCPSSGDPVFLSRPGTCLPQDAIGALRGVLSSTTYTELLPYTHGKH